MNENDPMHMIWHDHKRILIHIWEMGRDFVQAFLCDFAQRVNPHLAAHNLPKQALPPQCDNRDVVSSRL
jgi:hypothetical protein